MSTARPNQASRQTTTESTATAEIVSYRTARSASDTNIAGAAHGLAPFLADCEGFVSRCLSRDADGRWTDHLLWTDAKAARRAAERLMADPAGARFLALIDGASVRMMPAPVVAPQRA